jgi:DedD protein
MVNVGLFANPDNANKAYARLQEAGLPAHSDALKSAKGALTRVRVGPFENQSEADSAAEKIRALHLDAAVVKS